MIDENVESPQPVQESAKLVDAILREASGRLFQNLDAFWPTDPGWDVHEANLVAQVHGSAVGLGHRAYAEVPVQVPETKRMDLLVFVHHGKPDELSIWIEAKRIWKQGQGDEVLSDITRLTASSTRLGDRLTRRPPGPGVAVFMALTHKADVATWWAKPRCHPAPFAGQSSQSISGLLMQADWRGVYPHPNGQPRPTWVLAASWQRTSA